MNKQFITDEKELLALRSDFKKQFCYNSPFAFVLDGKMVMVGEYEMDNNELEIKHVVSFQSRKGHGRILIDHLLHDLGFDEVWGESMVQAYHFWRKVGAVFEETSEKFFLEHEKEEGYEFEEGFLIPFNIYKPKTTA